mgnify:FL=1
MKRLLGLLLATGMVLGSSAIADATVVHFDDLSHYTSVPSIPSGYGGLDWNNMAAYNTLLGAQVSGYKNGVVSPKNVAFNKFGTPAVISRLTPFDFTGAYLPGAWNNGLNVNLKGYNGVNLVYDSTVVVNSTSPTYFNFNYLGITSLRLDSYGGVHGGYTGSRGTHLVLDNFTYNPVSSVPEPATLFLLGSGVVGLIAARRFMKS